MNETELGEVNEDLNMDIVDQEEVVTETTTETTETLTTDTDTTEVKTLPRGLVGAIKGSDANLNWVVVYKGTEAVTTRVGAEVGTVNRSLVGFASGITAAKNLVSDFLIANPTVDSNNVEPMSLGKAMEIKTKEIHTF